MWTLDIIQYIAYRSVHILQDYLFSFLGHVESNVDALAMENPLHLLLCLQPLPLLDLLAEEHDGGDGQEGEDEADLDEAGDGEDLANPLHIVLLLLLLLLQVTPQVSLVPERRGGNIISSEERSLFYV